jgi:hypothetical protein
VQRWKCKQFSIFFSMIIESCWVASLGPDLH